MMMGYGTEFTRGDPARIAAQAISGIGFLGAGVILRYKDMIRGLTTAACMWVACPIGQATGSGYYFALITTGITVAAQVSKHTAIGEETFPDYFSASPLLSFLLHAIGHTSRANPIPFAFWVSSPLL